MPEYPLHLKKLTEEINRLLCKISEQEKIQIEKIIEDSKSSTIEYIKSYFGEDEKLDWNIDIDVDSDLFLADIKPKNLYTACKFLGFEVGIECPIEGQAVFDRITIMYDHKDGMTILPKDPNDNLNDILPIF